MFIKVNQTCLNYFVEKKVAMVSFYSFRFSAIFPPDCMCWITRGEFTRLTIDVCRLRCFSIPKTHEEVRLIRHSQKDQYNSVENNSISLYFSNWFIPWMSAYEQHFLRNTPHALWNSTSYSSRPSDASSKGHGWDRGPCKPS